jgi:hypothetical protein
LIVLVLRSEDPVVPATLLLMLVAPAPVIFLLALVPE